MYVNGMCRSSCPSSYHVPNSERECGELLRVKRASSGVDGVPYISVYCERSESLNGPNFFLLKNEKHLKMNKK